MNFLRCCLTCMVYYYMHARQFAGYVIRVSYALCIFVRETVLFRNVVCHVVFRSEAVQISAEDLCTRIYSVSVRCHTPFIVHISIRTNVVGYVFTGTKERQTKSLMIPSSVKFMSP